MTSKTIESTGMTHEQRRALIEFVREAILSTRVMAWGCHKLKGRLSGKTERRIADLMDLIHNIPGYLLHPEGWDDDWFREDLERHDKRWSTNLKERYKTLLAGDTIKREIALKKGGGEMLHNEYRGGRRHGLSRDWYDNEQLRLEEAYVEGYQEGPSRSWFANGQQACEGEWRGGVRHGKWTYWDEEGNLLKTETFNEGQHVE